jgi:phytoene synthase
MTSPDRAFIVAEARQTIARGSKSFRMASRLFDRETRERAWLLYTWCRACDDAADGQTLGHGAKGPADGALERLRQGTERALAGEPTGELPFEALRLVAAECAIPRRFVEDHLAGFEMDLEGWRPRTEADLLLYCYRVAGAVGCMMAIVMGVDPEDLDTLDRAADLGIAFQLANIARDVSDDHAMGRCYLPAEWLEERRVPSGEHLRYEHRRSLAALAARLGTLSDAYERSARTGAQKLPFRSRWAVLSAASIYGGIAREVVRRGPAAWDRRVVIGRPEKLGCLARGWREARAGQAGAEPRDHLWTRPR